SAAAASSRCERRSSARPISGDRADREDAEEHGLSEVLVVEVLAAEVPVHDEKLARARNGEHPLFDPLSMPREKGGEDEHGIVVTSQLHHAEDERERERLGAP